MDPRTFKNATLLLCVFARALFFVAINDGSWGYYFCRIWDHDDQGWVVLRLHCDNFGKLEKIKY